jgi:hypothetical protein
MEVTDAILSRFKLQIYVIASTEGKFLLKEYLPAITPEVPKK